MTAPAPRSQGRLLLAATLVAFTAALSGVAHQLVTTEVTADGERYRDMARSFWRTGDFRADFLARDFPQPNEVENGYTHYFSPLWPIFQVPFWLALGPAGFEVAYVVAAGLSLAIAYATTRHLHGAPSALAAVAFLGTALFHMSGQRATEPLALAFFTLMLWAILQSVEPGKQSWILLAGAMAGLAYLTRASVGWLFLLGGAAGVAWRIRFHARGALNPRYVAAIGLFAVAWGAWALRNVSHFWDGTLSGLPHALAADAVFEWKFRRALEEPLLLASVILLKTALAFMLLCPFFVLRHRALLQHVRSLANERESGHLLTWAVAVAMGIVISAVFTVADYSPTSPTMNLDNLRYFIFAIPGLVWSLWRHPTPGARPAPAGSPTPAPFDVPLRAE